MGTGVAQAVQVGHFSAFFEGLTVGHSGERLAVRGQRSESDEEVVPNKGHEEPGIKNEKRGGLLQ